MCDRPRAASLGRRGARRPRRRRLPERVGLGHRRLRLHRIHLLLLLIASARPASGGVARILRSGRRGRHRVSPVHRRPREASLWLSRARSPIGAVRLRHREQHVGLLESVGDDDQLVGRQDQQAVIGREQRDHPRERLASVARVEILGRFAAEGVERMGGPRLRGRIGRFGRRRLGARRFIAHDADQDALREAATCRPKRAAHARGGGVGHEPRRVDHLKLCTFKGHQADDGGARDRVLHREGDELVDRLLCRDRARVRAAELPRDAHVLRHRDVDDDFHVGVDLRRASGEAS